MNDAKPELQGPNRLTWNVDVIYGNFHRVRWFLYFEYTRVLYPARALRALGLLLADGAPTVGGGKTF